MQVKHAFRAMASLLLANIKAPEERLGITLTYQVDRHVLYWLDGRPAGRKICRSFPGLEEVNSRLHLAQGLPSETLPVAGSDFQPKYVLPHKRKSCL